MLLVTHFVYADEPEGGTRIAKMQGRKRNHWGKINEHLSRERGKYKMSREVLIEMPT